MDSVPLGLRIANALVAYINYMLKLLWPKNLAVFYPYPAAIPFWQVLGASVVLAGITIGVIYLRKRQPYLGVGWLWFVGTLVPVSGLSQVGLWPALADRWAYVPFIGLFIMVAWGVIDLIHRWQRYRIGLILAAGGILIFFTITARAQVDYWKNSIALFEREIKVAGSSWIAHQNLAAALYQRGRVADAKIHFQIAENGPPRTPEGKYYLLALTLTTMGESDKALKGFREALRINPNFVPAHIQLGMLLLRKGRMGDAVSQLQSASELDPANLQTQRNLNIALAINREVTLAAGRLQASMVFDPEDPLPAKRLEELRLRKKDLDIILERYQKFTVSLPGVEQLDYDNIEPVFQIKKQYEGKFPALKSIAGLLPGNADACYHIACIYARRKQTIDAVAWLRRAVLNGFDDWEHLKIDSDLINIQHSKTYKEFISEHVE